jgi:uncharacterized repeat protein (TIGR03803 family)
MHPNFCQWNLRVVAVAGILSCSFIPSWALAATVTEQILHSFRNGKDGAQPEGGLIADQKGNLYGTTVYGGTGKGYSGFGTVFTVAPDGDESALYAFKGGSDGTYPTDTLLLDKNGNLYGTTTGGGTGCSPSGCGTVFKLAPHGKETLLYVFQGQDDGWRPLGGLIADANGNLFGTTALGGSYNGECAQTGCGTVFELTPGGTIITLHAFQGGSDGYGPSGGVIMDSSGNLYGTTYGGGSGTNCEFGCGLVFKLTPDGTYAVLYAFQGGSDGSAPEAGLVTDAAGNLYGTTFWGGDTNSCSDGCGTVFKLTPAGQESVLHAFHYGSDGGSPEAGLLMDKKGNLYGTTFAGGSNSGCKKSGFTGCGTVFEVSPEGVETVLYRFSRSQGGNPAAGLLPGAHGDFYGTTEYGAKGNNGVVFELKE